MKKALITGITGQDGSYLSEYLLSKGYSVYGMIRKSSTFNTSRIDHLYQEIDHNVPPDWARPWAPNFYLIYGDLLDGSSIARTVFDVEPDEVYNLGAQAHVKVSFDQPEMTMNINCLGNLRLLEAVHSLSLKKEIKFYQASSSEMFGNYPNGTLLNESTPFNPCSPYAISKCAAFWNTYNYRKKGLFAVNGMLFNHESPRRGATYVTRKITIAATRIAVGLQKELVLGNIEASRDWGYAPDYIKAMHMIMQAQTPDDYVVATGESKTVRQFLEAVFSKLNLDPYKYIKIDKRYFRPIELDNLRGDASKIKKTFNWTPETDFNKLVDVMVESDLEKAKQEFNYSKIRN